MAWSHQLLTHWNDTTRRRSGNEFNFFMSPLREGRPLLDDSGDCCRRCGIDFVVAVIIWSPCPQNWLAGSSGLCAGLVWRVGVIYGVGRCGLPHCGSINLGCLWVMNLDMNLFIIISWSLIFDPSSIYYYYSRVARVSLFVHELLRARMIVSTREV